MITAVTSSSASVHHRRAVIPSDACIAATSELAVGSVSPRQAKTFAQTPAQRHVAGRARGAALTRALMAAVRSALSSVPARGSLVKNEYPPPTADHDRSGLLLQRPERVPCLHRAPSLRPVQPASAGC